MQQKLKIKHYTSVRISNPNPDGPLSWQKYHMVRNAVFRCCQKFGRAGLMAECPITADESVSDVQGWLASGADLIDFFVIDDQYNDDQYNDERYIYVEVQTQSVFTEVWITAVMQTLSEHPGWGVGLLNLKGYLLIFADRLMVTGDLFRDCTDLACLVRQAELAVA